MSTMPSTGGSSLSSNGGAPDSPLNQLTAREAELLKKAGERVYALSRRVAERDREVQELTSESQGLRDLLAESREVRKVLVSQVESLQTQLDREYSERSELRRLLASLHVQMQELLPSITGLAHERQLPTPPAAVEPAGRAAPPPGLRGRLMRAAKELRDDRSRRR